MLYGQQFDFKKLQDLIGLLAFDALKQKDLLIISLKILDLEKEEPTKAELAYFTKELTLPLLQLLVQAKRKLYGYRAGSENSPILYIPLINWLRRDGSNISKQKLSDKLQQIKSRERVYILFDTWLSSRPLESLLQLWSDIDTSEMGELKLIGPNPSEIQQLAIKRKEPLSKLLAYLKSSAIYKIEAGNDLELTQISSAAGLSSTYTQTISNSDMADQSFFEILRKLKAISIQNSETKLAWSIKNSPTEDSAERLLISYKAIALASLILPRSFEIIAPSGLLGTKEAKFALAIGASNCGYTAIDSETAELLSLPKSIKHSEDQPRKERKVA